MKIFSKGRRVATAVCALVCAGAAGAQQAPAGSAAADGKMSLNVIVQSKSGGAVTGLHAEDFTILDGKAQVRPSSFAELGEPGVQRVILVLDNVNNPFSIIAIERQELGRFLRSNGGQLAAPTSLAVVTDTGTKLQDQFTRNGEAVAAQLDKTVNEMHPFQQRTDFYSQVERFRISVTALHNLIAHNPGNQHTAVIWISAGWPWLSGPGMEMDKAQRLQFFQTIRGMFNDLRQSNTTLYAVNPGHTIPAYEAYLKPVKNPIQAEPGNLSLQVLARQSGGLVLGNRNDLAAELTECYADASHTYQISYDLPPADKDVFRPVQVQVSKPETTVRARVGYYVSAPPS